MYDENTSLNSRFAEISISGSGVNSQSVSVLQEGAIPSAVEPVSKEGQIQAFPNPVSNKTRITYPRGTSELIEIYGPSGRLIIRLEDTDRNGETEIDFSRYEFRALYVQAF